MKESDLYHKWVEWSNEDQVYIGKCPDLIDDIHGDDSVKLYGDLCEVIEGVVSHYKEQGRQLPIPRVQPMQKKYALENPEYLYKYKSFNDFEKKSSMIFTRNLIFYPKPIPEHFNDPYDCRITISENNYHETWCTIMSQQNRHHYELAKQVHSSGVMKNMSNESYEKTVNGVLSITKNLGILCLTAVNDSMLMWSHYGDKHQGFCIEFERNNNNGLVKGAVEIEYSNDFPIIDLELILSGYKNYDEAYIKSINRLWTVKSTEWLYEHEWRHMQDEGNKLYPIPAKISSVIFGASSDERNIEKLRLAIEKSGQNIKFKKAQLENNKFQIVIKDI